MSTIFTSTLNANADSNGGLSFRNVLVISGGALDQVRVTFVPSTTVGNNRWIANNASIGIWTGANADTVSTPVELLFGGVSGFDITDPTTITSDWLNFNGFTSSDKLVVIIDNAATANVRINSSEANASFWFKGATASYNVAAPAGFSNFATDDWGVSLVEVQSVAGDTTLMAQAIF